MNLNQVFLIGRLGSDPDIKKFENGGQIAIVNLAVDSPYYDKEKNHWVSNPDWIRCVFSDKVAERAAELNKGDEILVQGKIKVRGYEDKDGNKRTITEVKGTFKKGRTKSSGSSQQSEPEQSSPGQANQQSAPDNSMQEEDDLPF